jgi:hypothetical protein
VLNADETCASLGLSLQNTATLARRADHVMIEREDMMTPMLRACPSFESAWLEFVNEWREESDKPLYLALGSLARHLISMLAAQDTSGLSSAFAVVERWHVEGDAYVREAASVGLLEDLQNEGLHESTRPADFERFLLPESLKWWRKVARFWSHGEILREDEA